MQISFSFCVGYSFSVPSPTTPSRVFSAKCGSFKTWKGRIFALWWRSIRQWRSGEKISVDSKFPHRRHRSFRVSVLWRRFLIQRLNILYFFMFSRANLLNIVDRLVKKTETKNDAIVSKKQVSLIKEDWILTQGASCPTGLHSEFSKSRGRFASRLPLSSRFIRFKQLAHSEISSKSIPLSLLDVYASICFEKKGRFAAKCDVSMRSWSFCVLRFSVETVRCEQNFVLRLLFKTDYYSHCNRFHIGSSFLVREGIFW